MPDHVHFVIWLLDEAQDAGGRSAAHGAQPRAPTLGNAIGAFKTVAARRINALHGTTGRSVWQRNYFEHIVRDDDELVRIRDYIEANPAVAHEHDGSDLKEAWASQQGSQGRPSDRPERAAARPHDR